MTTEDASTCFNTVSRCSNRSSTSSCQQLSPTPSPPMSPAPSVMSESSMSSVDNDSRSDSEDDGDEGHRSRLQVTYMRPGCIEEHIIKSRTLAAAKVAAAAGAGPTPMEQ
ncbi:hypothetical protein K457DRAFT_887985 [Linnemannia elongata AG-77]|uniref:Uncharacterized protein n=1 Tax=Linnemannia elongata AG-77 TaxID=1314771 RepID=A0A197JD13_9FUNG|nr:hypothetical protein K457DRAFT_887985 [Linnemannia elongata AG-77]